MRRLSSFISSRESGSKISTMERRRSFSSGDSTLLSLALPSNRITPWTKGLHPMIGLFRHLAIVVMNAVNFGEHHFPGNSVNRGKSVGQRAYAPGLSARTPPAPGCADPRVASRRSRFSRKCRRCEELLQHGGDGLWGYVVLLPLQGASLPIGDDVRERLRRVAHPRRARATGDHERGCRDGGNPLAR